MKNEHYSPSRTQKSLHHFILGKGASAALSVCFLVVAARHMPNAEFGIYVVMLAALDIFYLSTGFGLSTVAQRYVAEFRIKAGVRQFRSFLQRMFFYRLGSSVVFALAIAVLWPWIAQSLDLAGQHGLRGVAVTLLVLSASGFFLDEVLGSLLMQGLFQLLAIIKILVRLGGGLLLIHFHGQIEVTSLLVLECGGALASLLLGHWALNRALVQDAASDNVRAGTYGNDRMWAASRKFYLVQLLGQIYGPNVSRLLVSRLLGITQTATFGFAQSVADMLRNFMPAHLLAGWLRPLMVSRYLLRRDVGDLAAIANVMLKLNLLGIIPLAVFFLLRGDAFGFWLSGGRYPDVGTLFVLLSAMIGLQTAHLLLAMVTITLEQPNANIAATVLAAVGVPISIVLIVQFGTSGAAIGLLVCELVWLATASYLLAKNGVRLAWDFSRVAVMVAAGIGSAIILYYTGFGAPSFIELTVSALVVAGSFGFLVFLLKPLRPEEREVISEFIPARFVVI